MTYPRVVKIARKVHITGMGLEAWLAYDAKPIENSNPQNFRLTWTRSDLHELIKVIEFVEPLLHDPFTTNDFHQMMGKLTVLGMEPTICSRFWLPTIENPIMVIYEELETQST